MKNLTYILPFVLWTAIPHTQNRGSAIQKESINVKIEEIIQHKTDSIKSIASDSIPADIKKINKTLHRIDSLKKLDKQLKKRLDSIKTENQYKRITKEFNF